MLSFFSQTLLFFLLSYLLLTLSLRKMRDCSLILKTKVYIERGNFREIFVNLCFVQSWTQFLYLSLILLAMSVWVSPCQTRSIELDIRYLLSIWSQIYRIPLRAGLLYTVIITENYNQFYHQSTLTQCTQNRLASPYAILTISPILQNFINFTKYKNLNKRSR